MPVRKTFFHAHRYIGVFCALFVVLLAVTGMMLNHTEELALDERKISSPAILELYGISAPRIDKGFNVDSQWFAQVGDRFYLNTTRVASTDAPIVGAVKHGDFYIAASSSQLILINQEGQLVERLSALHGVPDGIQQIGIDRANQLPVVKTADGVFLGDAELFEWQNTESIPAVEWSEPHSLPGQLVAQLSRQHMGDGLTLERVLLDLHSGRIAGYAGVLLMDFIALLFLFLAVVGVWLWLNPKANNSSGLR